MAKCPNCGARVRWDALECGMCSATFGANAWHPSSESPEEEQQLLKSYPPAPPVSTDTVSAGWAFSWLFLLIVLVTSNVGFLGLLVLTFVGPLVAIGQLVAMSVVLIQMLRRRFKVCVRNLAIIGMGALGGAILTFSSVYLWFFVHI